MKYDMKITSNHSKSKNFIKFDSKIKEVEQMLLLKTKCRQ